MFELSIYALIISWRRRKSPNSIILCRQYYDTCSAVCQLLYKYPYRSDCWQKSAHPLLLVRYYIISFKGNAKFQAFSKWLSGRLARNLLHVLKWSMYILIILPSALKKDEKYSSCCIGCTQRQEIQLIVIWNQQTRCSISLSNCILFLSRKR